MLMNAGEDQALSTAHEHTDATVGTPATPINQRGRHGTAHSRAEGGPEHDTLHSELLAQISAQKLGDNIAPIEAGQYV